jgi:hypothetical protein
MTGAQAIAEGRKTLEVRQGKRYHGRWHRTPAAADRCREQATAAIRRGHGPSAYYFGHELVLVEDEGGRYVRRARDEEWG